ncbi:MAG: molybdopterin molybdotransferase MoeA [Propionibacteriaceae bacterium]|jgi:molybdopterin molybdotransferase|nr:molybdopterin molybdotransferase MoeA [Propionibacteriaceae bacterium]
MAIFGKKKAEATPASEEVAAAPPVAEPVVTVRSYLEQRDFLLSKVEAPRPFGIGILEVGGLTICESLDSDIDLPVFTAANIDGWAVRSSNLVGASYIRPAILPLLGDVPANAWGAEPLTPGATKRIAAGGPVPDGADAVVPLEYGVIVDEGVKFTAEIPFQANLRARGSRIADGDPLLPAGSVLNPRSIAMLAEVGQDKVLAMARPRVAVGTLGSELIEPGRPLLRRTQHYDSTTAMLAAAVKVAGAHPYAIGILPTDPAGLQRVLFEQLSTTDLIIIAAPPSELLEDVLGRLGEVDTTPVAVKPTGPQLFATIGETNTPVLVVPDTAASAYISFYAFALPLINKLAGTDPSTVQAEAAPAAAPIMADPTHTQFVLAIHTSRGVTPLELPEGAGGVELANANALIVVPPGIGISPGQGAICWLFDQ